MKRLLLTTLIIHLTLTVCVAQKRERYEFRRNLPVYADSLLKDLTYPLAWGNSPITDFAEWKHAARQKVLDCMLTPPPPMENGELRIENYDYTKGGNTAEQGNHHWSTNAAEQGNHNSQFSILNSQLISEEQREGYKARKIDIPLSRYYSVPAYVLIPDGEGPFPAVNVLHDHGAHLFIGKEKMIRPLACEDSTVIRDADEWVASLYDSQYVGDYLARHGYVVFSADAPMWGERGQEEGPRRDKYDMIAGNMMMYGIDLSAYMTYDDLSGTEFLASMPEVDASRIGCFGCSMGAYRAWMLAALSPRIKATVAVCWMTTTDEQLSFRYQRTENGGFANCLPGLRRWLDYPHIASLACPNAMLFINGTEDKLFPVAGAEKAFAIMRDVWHSQGADDRFESELWDMPHHCPLRAQERALQFFDKHLRN